MKKTMEAKLLNYSECRVYGQGDLVIRLERRITGLLYGLLGSGTQLLSHPDPPSTPQTMETLISVELGRPLGDFILSLMAFIGCPIPLNPKP